MPSKIESPPIHLSCKVLSNCVCVGVWPIQFKNKELHKWHKWVIFFLFLKAFHFLIWLNYSSLYFKFSFSLIFRAREVANLAENLQWKRLIWKLNWVGLLKFFPEYFPNFLWLLIFQNDLDRAQESVVLVRSWDINIWRSWLRTVKKPF